METIKITIDDEETKELVVRLLHQIKGVTINGKKAIPSRNSAAALKELSGIWAGRDLTITELRNKAWRIPKGDNS
jgi:hypothetical protein